MKKENQTIIIIGIILLVLAFFVLPNLGLFVVYPPSNGIIPSDDSYVEEVRTGDNNGDASSMRAGWTSHDKEYISYIKFKVDSTTAGLVRAGANLQKASVYLYIRKSDSIDIVFVETSNSWNEETITWKNKPTTGSTIVNRHFGGSDEDKYIEIDGFISYFEKVIRSGSDEVSIAIRPQKYEEGDTVHFRTKDYLTTDGYSPYLILQMEQVITCTENEIKQLENDYYICRNKEWQKILDVLDLSDEEQARLMDIINDLETTVEEKAQIIENLTVTLEGQLIMIEQLEILTTEKAQIIIQLKLNLEEQALIISEMELTVAEQAEIVKELDLTIQEQAQLIQQMQTNLVQKAALIQQLEVENENQARLIAEMELSFAEQAEIINALENLIGDDAEIVTNLYNTINEQAQLINELELTNEELAELVASMDLPIQENADLINELKLTTEEQLEIIVGLELSLEEERELIAELRDTIEEQNKLIEELDQKKIDLGEFDLEEIGGSLKEIWEENKTFILIISGIFLLLLLMGGKKRR